MKRRKVQDWNDALCAHPVHATSGWFDTAATTINAYWTGASSNAQPFYTTPVLTPQRESEPKVTDPLDWLRSRVGEYVEAGALA